MPAPGAVINPSNPYKSIVGPTWGGGTNTNSIYALNNPALAAAQRQQAMQRGQAGMGAMPPSSQQMYGQQPSPSYGMGGNGRGYGGGEGYGQGYPNYHSQAQTNQGANAPASGRVGYRGPLGSNQPIGSEGLASYYNLQRQGNGPLDQMNDQNAVGQYLSQFRTAQSAGIRAMYPCAFPQDQSQEQSGQPTGFSDFNASTGKWEASQPGGFSFVAPSQPLVGPPSEAANQQFGPPDQRPSSYNPSTGQWGPDVPGRAKGGPVGPKPYLVGEKGPEIYKSKSGQHEIIGAQGPEVRTFPQDGKIIPNKDVKKYMLKMRANGGSVDGSFNFEPSRPVDIAYGQKGSSNPWFNLTPRAGGGQVQGGYAPTNYGPPQSSYGMPQQPISPYAMQYLPQQQVDPAYAQAYQQAQQDPNAPESPWAMARYVRMGLQNAARRKLAYDSGVQAVAELKAKQAVADGLGYTPPVHPANTGFQLSTPYGNGSSTLRLPGSGPGMFTAMDINGAPASFPMSAPASDPSQVTWPQMNMMQQAHPPTQGHPNPLLELLGRNG